MRVLLINSNREKTPAPLIPLGLCYVASSTRATGHEVELLDLCFSRHPRRDLVRSIEGFGPEVIGISLRNLDNADSGAPKNFVDEVEPIVQACREATGVPIVLGGSALGIAPEPILRALGCEYAIVGDGEEAFPELLSKLEEAGRATGEGPAGLEDIPGLAVLRDGAFRLNPVSRIVDLDALPRPRTHHWLALDRYFNFERTVTLQTKRGCSLRCIYCTYNAIEGFRHRLRSPASVADEIEEALEATGVGHFEFVDSAFNVPEEHARAVCAEIADRGLPVHLQTYNFNPSSVTPELLVQMRRARFEFAGCTVESASDSILSNLRKGFTVADIEKVIACNREPDVLMVWFLMFGAPGEDPDSVRETLDFVSNRIPKHNIVLISSGLRIYPGTELARIAAAEGVIDAGADLYRPTFYFSMHLDRDELAEHVDRACDDHPNYLNLTNLAGSFSPLIPRLGQILDLPRPVWSFLPRFNAYRRALRRGDRAAATRAMDAIMEGCSEKSEGMQKRARAMLARMRDQAEGGGSRDEDKS